MTVEWWPVRFKVAAMVGHGWLLLSDCIAIGFYQIYQCQSCPVLAALFKQSQRMGRGNAADRRWKMIVLMRGKTLLGKIICIVQRSEVVGMQVRKSNNNCPIWAFH